MSLIDNKQKSWIKRYQRMADLPDHDYRALLNARAGVTSCTQLDQNGYDKVMAGLETVLFERVDAGHVPFPRGIGRNYWRKRLTARGGCNSRLRYTLERWWRMLTDYLPESERNEAYLAGIIRHAIGWNGPVAWFNGEHLVWERLHAENARLAIEAIKDRLRHAVSKGAA